LYKTCDVFWLEIVILKHYHVSSQVILSACLYSLYAELF